jgi:hypothetical protein
MSTPRPRKAPKLKAEPEAREVELIGCDEDGWMSLWSVGMVRPVTRFESHGRWIEDGHYVIQWKGHAITVHCGNFADGTVSVLFMCSRLRSISLPRAKVEAMLLGKVIPDPEAVARISESLRQLSDSLHARTRAPHLQRGRI